MTNFEALNAIPIASVCAALGMKVATNGRARCPMPEHEDRDPSFSLRQATNTFKCFACGEWGGVIDLVMKVERLDLVRAVCWLGERFGSEVRPRQAVRAAAIRARPLTQPKIAVEPAYFPDTEIFSWLMTRCPLRASGRSYLEGRGFSGAIIARFEIGQVDDRAAIFREACARFDLARLERCGLVSTGRYGPFLAYPSDFLLFPFMDQGGIRYVQGRNLKDGKARRWANLSKLAPPAYNLDALTSDASTILICEGVTDVLSAVELGQTAIGLLGANSKVEPSVIARLKGFNVIVVGDADDAGQAFARALVARLGSHGITAMTRRPPDGANDLNAYLLQRRSNVQ
ncbi:hypothetical protein GRI62_00830 [Erythrobacter arachoides]|uniref:Toprim domain-containing protein n=1 Tax=Aurantiacibacter arachoides TaxID=1850444 RepID=A0A845A3G7_9SPHN|nr:CHC2 zinc finger domain-containing protein [Aurantiacibacter arachoides]MXO92149.1 hypothetical protein [Aurantiacibacter arachoides]GGD59310.1 hypothetical protein GCM10011411_19400 [Aurantiacibacter arachoides]